MNGDAERPSGTGWSLFSNHALVLVYVLQHPDSTVREISRGVGITERATLTLLRTLDEASVIERQRDGRRNTYAVNFDRLASFRRAAVAPLTPREFIEPLLERLLSISVKRPGDARVASPRVPAHGERRAPAGPWGFFSNQLRVLIAIAINSTRTVHDIAVNVGVTERAAVSIVKQLESDGLIERTREGRRNTYAIKFDALRRSPRWSSGNWPFPQTVIDVSVDGLRALIDSRTAASG